MAVCVDRVKQVKSSLFFACAMPICTVLLRFWGTIKYREIHHSRHPYSKTEAPEGVEAFLIQYIISSKDVLDLTNWYRIRNLVYLGLVG